jgi:hypothetical protein
MKYFLSLLIAFTLPSTAFAAAGDWFMDPHGAVGFNPAQGTHFMLGVDIGMEVTLSTIANMARARSPLTFSPSPAS